MLLSYFQFRIFNLYLQFVESIMITNNDAGSGINKLDKLKGTTPKKLNYFVYPVRRDTNLLLITTFDVSPYGKKKLLFHKYPDVLENVSGISPVIFHKPNKITLKLQYSKNYNPNRYLSKRTSDLANKESACRAVS